MTDYWNDPPETEDCPACPACGSYETCTENDGLEGECGECNHTWKFEFIPDIEPMDWELPELPADFY